MEVQEGLKFKLKPLFYHLLSPKVSIRFNQLIYYVLSIHGSRPPNLIARPKSSPTP